MEIGGKGERRNKEMNGIDVTKVCGIECCCKCIYGAFKFLRGKYGYFGKCFLHAPDIREVVAYSACDYFVPIDKR